MGIPIMKMDKLLKAFNNSTPSTNLFELEVRRIKWDNIFSEDGDYSAYFVYEEIEIPSHYRKVFECKNSLWIYDDEERTLKVNGERIEIYRAGDFGCIIYAPDGNCSYM